MSYTSNSEYDANSRPTITNEVPPYDYYQGVNSVLTDNMWKWLLGYTSVTFDLPSKAQEIDRKGAAYVTDKDDYYHKIVNGEFSKEYGPKVTQVWNPQKNDYETRWPEYHSIEVYGGLTTEEDLFLHEIYRYLHLLYPDHPEWLKLLTKNEVSDAFMNAAALVNYKPDDVFFDKVAEALDPTNKDEEAFKITLRNLKNNAYRRKLYGSKLGYNMFAHDIFSTCSIFPLGTYLPIQSVPMQYKDANGNTVGKDEIKSKINDTVIKKNYTVAIPPKSLKNRFIDTFDGHYYNKFRLIDWTGESQDFKTLDTSVITFSLFNTPIHRYEFYETEYDSFNIEQNVNGNDLFFNLKDDNSYYVVDEKQKVDSYALEMTNTSSEHVTYTVTKLSISQDVPLNYFCAYTALLAEENLVTDANKKAMTRDNLQTVMKTLAEDRSIDIIKDPVNQGNFYLRPSNILSYYRSDPVKFNDGFYPINDDVEDEYVIGSAYNPDTTDFQSWNWPPLNINSESFARRKSVALDRNNLLFNDHNLIQVNVLDGTESININALAFATTGFVSTTRDQEPGMFYIDIEQQDLYTYTAPETYTMSPTYGIIVTNTYGDKIVLLGRLMSIENGIVNAMPYQPQKLVFQVKVIPEEKDVNFLTLCYGYKSSYSDVERANKKLLYNSDVVSAAHNLQDELDSYFVLNNINGIDTGLQMLGVIHIFPGSDGYELAPQFGTGTVTKFDFGNVSTIAIFENDMLKTYSSQVMSINNDLDSIKIEDNYVDVSVPFNDELAFLHYENYQKLDIEYNTIVIASTVNVSNDSSKNVITFEDEVSRELSKSLSVGDRIFGPTIPIIDENNDNINDGLYITDIGVNQITVSHNLTKSGTFNFFYQCKLDITNITNDEKYKTYREKLYLSDSLQLQDPFKRVLWPQPAWPNVAGGFVDGFNDIGQYSPFVKNNINDAAEISYLTTKVIPTLHSSDENLIGQDTYGNYIYSQQIIPCSVKFLNDLFVDININKVFSGIKNRAGQDENLLNVEWIDYFSNNAKELTRANDNVSFGAHLLMETDTSGFYSLLQNQDYTDPSVKLRFQTFDWGIDTVPAYAQIGVGTNGDLDYLFKSVSSLVYPTIWGSAVYDAPIVKDPLIDDSEGVDEIQKDYTDNEGTIKTRHVWTDPNERISLQSDKAQSITSIEAPIAEINLGEYDIQMHYKPQVDNAQTVIDVTTVQCNFYKQTFNNITKEAQLSVFPEKLVSPNMFIDSNVADTDETNLQTTQKMSFQFKGVFTSKVDVSGTLQLPDIKPLIEDYENGIISYYIVKTLSTYSGVYLSNDILNKTLSVYGQNDDTDEQKHTISTLSSTWGNIDNSFSKTKLYDLVLQPMSILVIEKVNNEYIFANKSFEFVGLLGNLNIQGISTAYNEGTISVSSMLKKSLGVLSAYEDSSIDLTGNFSGSGYFSPSFGGITKNEDDTYQLHRKTTAEVDDYTLAFMRFFGKDKVNEDGTPYYINTDEVLYKENNVVDVLKNIFFCYVDFEKETAEIEEIVKNKPESERSDLEKSLIYDYYTRNHVSDDDIVAVYPQIVNNAIQYRVVKLDNTIAFMSALSLNKNGMATKEWEYVSNDETAFYRNRLDTITNVFQLPRKFIAEGSYDLDFIVDPKFKSTVYKYEDYVEYKKGNIFDLEPYEQTRCITGSAIFYDKDYDCFYIQDQYIDTAYERAGGEITDSSNTVITEKYVIKFNENKFFKNANYSAGSYQLIQSQTEGSTSVTYTPTIKSVDGLNLGIDKITSDDILLQAELIQLRSIYNNSLKHKLFSAYQNVEGQLDSIKKVGNDYQLTISYDTASIVANENVENANDPLLTIKSRNDMMQQVMGLLPAKITYLDEDENEEDKVEVYSKDSTVTFANDKLVWDTITYKAPPVVDLRATKIFAAAKNTDTEFKYFKNLLVFEARVDMNNPRLLITTGSNMFTEAQQQISPGDSILQISALTGTASTNKSIALFDSNGKEINIDSACYGNGKLVATSGISIYVHSTNDLGSEANIRMKQIDAPVLSGVLSARVSKINLIDGYFYFTAHDTSSSTPITHILRVEADMIDSPLLTALEPAFEESQAYISDMSGNVRAINAEEDDIATLMTSTSMKIVYPIRDHTDNNVITILDWKSDVVNSASIESRVLSKDVVHSDIVETWTDFNTTNTHTYYPEGETFTVTTSLQPVFTVDNSTGYQALVKGDYIFIKAPISTVDETGEYDGGQTSFLHWKAAKLPAALDVSYASLFSMTPEMFREFVVGVLEGLANYDLGEGSGTSYEVQVALRNWVRTKFKEGSGPFAGKIIKERDEEDEEDNVPYKCGIMTEDEFEEQYKNYVNSSWTDENGAKYNTYVTGFTVKTINDQKYGYIGDQYKYGISLLLNPSKPFNAESNPVSYGDAYRAFVFDIFQYIFGYIDAIEMFKDGVSSAYFSEGKLYLKTRKGDFIALDQSKFFKREDIENASSWTILEMPPDTSFTSSNPLAGSYRLYADVKISTTTQTLQASLPAAVPVSPTKAYHISTKYEDDTIIIYGGYLMSRNEIKNRYNETYAAQSYESFCNACGATTYQKPFIMYSYDKTIFTVSFINYETLYDLQTKQRLNGTIAHSRVSGFIMQSGKIYALIAYLNGNGRWILADRVLQISMNDNQLWELQNNLRATAGTKFVELKSANIKESVLKNSTFAAIDEAHENEAREDASESGSGGSGSGGGDDGGSGGGGDSTGGNPAMPEYSTESVDSGDAKLSFVPSSNTIVVVVNADITGLDSGLLSITGNSANGVTVSNNIIDKDPDATGYIDVLLSVYTSKDIINPCSCIDPTHTNIFNSYNELKVSTTYEVEDPQIADRMYNRREVLGTTYEYDEESGEYVQTLDGDGYPSVEEDIDHILYEYSEIQTDGLVDYVVNDLENGYGNTVYLCNDRGDYFVQNNADTPIVVRFASVSKLAKNGLDPSISFVAPKPVVRTVNEASKDPELRQTDKDLTKYLTSLINSNSKVAEFCIVNTNPYLTITLSTAEDVFAKISSLVENATDYKIDDDILTFNDSYGRFVKSTINVGYESYGSRWTAQAQTFVDAIGDKPVTSIYIPIKGYGGTRDNETSWADIKPWELDKVAWTDEDWLNEYGDPIYLANKRGVPIEDAYGNLITMKIPVYQTYNSLIAAQGYEITDTLDIFCWKNSTNNGKYSQKGLTTISSLGENTYTLAEPLSAPESYKGLIDINDGKVHNIRLKFLPVQHVDLQITEMNNPDYIIEIPYDKLSTFYYDRIYFNAKGYPKSPVAIDNKIFRTENNDNYTVSKLESTIGNIIYECDENGKYIGYTIENKELKEVVLGDENGDLTNDVSIDVDKRFQPYSPLYDSCQKWFYDKFYINGKESNPFWQFITVSTEFNTSSLKFDQIVTYTKQAKSNTSYNKVALDDTERFFNVYNSIDSQNLQDKLNVYQSQNFVNLNTGRVQFLMTQNYDSKFYSSDDPSFILYGINVVNPKYDDENMFADDVNDALSHNGVRVIFNGNYSVNTTESFIDRNDKDAAIAQITEIGLFDKDHRLIAYAKHPPIEYRTDTQHVDYTMIISYNTLVDTANND